MGPDYVVAGSAYEFFARADRWLRGRRHREVRLRGADPGVVADDDDADRAGADAGAGAGVHADDRGLLAVSRIHAQQDGFLLSQAAALFGGGVQPGPWDQRCAEDHG